MTVEKSSYTPRAELLKIAKKHQKRALALGLRFHPDTSLSHQRLEVKTGHSRSPSLESNVGGIIKAPKQVQFTQETISDLVRQLEKDISDDNKISTLGMSITSMDLARLKACSQSLVSAAYHCLYMAAAASCVSEESCWIGSSAVKNNIGKNVFLERDWANGRLYYEAYYIFRLGLEDMMAFMKTNPSTSNLYASFEQPLKDLKVEYDNYIK